MHDAVSMPYCNLLMLATGKPSDSANDLGLVYVPRIPSDAAEADAMLAMTTVVCDATNPAAGVKTYAGYTESELRENRPIVRIGRESGRYARRLEQVQHPDYDPLDDPDFQAGIGRLVRSLEFAGLPDGGHCIFRAIAGKAMFALLDIDATYAIGSMVYRVGPDPLRDVLAFCGPHNSGCMGQDGKALFHVWLKVGGWFADFSVGDWHSDSRSCGEYDFSMDGVPLGKLNAALGPIQWTIPKPPEFWWKRRAEAEAAWRPDATPELGEAWYGPFAGTQEQRDEMLRRVLSVQEDVGRDIAREVKDVFQKAKAQFE
jgi:hypothetical protein